jgi:hypothetical protein
MQVRVREEFFLNRGKRGRLQVFTIEQCGQWQRTLSRDLLVTPEAYDLIEPAA